MVSSEVQNKFLYDLLDLQQDGRYAISAPNNWTHKPLLEVPTEIDDIIEILQNSILKGIEENDTARWHFFVGSPGNGKSAAMRKLCERLESKGCEVLDESGNPISSLALSVIPYAIYVREKGKSGKKFISVHIVQDASVVRKPFSSAVAAMELLATLKNAWESGVSLVVCTNRGVLEKAYWDNHLDRNINHTAWFKCLSGKVQQIGSLFIWTIKVQQMGTLKWPGKVQQIGTPIE